MLSKMKEQVTHLQSIRLLNDDEKALPADVNEKLCSDDLSIIIQNQPEHGVNQLLEFLKTVDRPPCIYFIAGDRTRPMIDLSMFPQNTQKLYLGSRDIGGASQSYFDLTARDGATLWPNLTHLFLPDSNFCISNKFVETLSEAIRGNKIPRLTHLTLEHRHLAGKFSQLLGSGCPSLRELNFRENLFVRTDESCWKELDLLSQLSSLNIGDRFDNFQCFDNDMKNIRHLNLTSPYIWKNGSFLKALSDGKFSGVTELKVWDCAYSFCDSVDIASLPALTHLSLEGISDKTTDDVLNHAWGLHGLCISGNAGMGGRVFRLFRDGRGFPSLRSLGLRKCVLTSQDLRCIAQARVTGFLPQLLHLDVSHNNQVEDFSSLFEFDCRWEKLLTLDVIRSKLETGFQDLQSLTGQLKSDCLGNLERLSVTVESKEFFPSEMSCWPSLVSIDISTTNTDTISGILSCLGDAKCGGYFPCLRSVTLYTRDVGSFAHASMEEQRLREQSVSVYYVSCVEKQ